MPARTSRPPARRPTRATFSDSLRDILDRDGRTPYAIGQAAGVDPGILSRFLRGQRGVTSDTIDRLAATLGFHVGVPARAKGRPRAGGPIVTLPAAGDAPAGVPEADEPTATPEAASTR